MTPLLIWGASSHAAVVADVVRRAGLYDILGFIEDGSTPGFRPYLEAAVVGGRDVLTRYRDDGISHLIVAIGDCAARVRLARVARAAGFELATAIHPAATVAKNASVGKGSVVAAGAIVNPHARIGDNVILNTAASVDHDCEIGDGAHIGPGCHLGGRVHVGPEAWIGIGAVIRDRVSIGTGTVVGAGSVVVGDLPAGVVAYGVPARVVKGARDAM